MKREYKNAARLGSRSGVEGLLQRDCIASPTGFAKWFTIWRYSHGYLSLEGCEAAFAAHPEWRRA